MRLVLCLFCSKYAEIEHYLIMLQHYDQQHKMQSTFEHEKCVRFEEMSLASDCLYPGSKSTSAVGLCHTSVSQSIVVRRPHRDFVGLESADAATRSAVINFSYHLTVGNMDEAFRAIRVVKW